MNALIIEALVRRLERTSVAECEYESCGVRVTLKFDRQALPKPPSVESLGNANSGQMQGSFVCAPRAGFFYITHPLESQPLVAVGDAVKKNQPVACLMIGELMSPVLAPADGVLGAPLAAQGALVGYGDALFSFEPVSS